MSAEFDNLIYENPLSTQKDVADFVMEGKGTVTFPKGRMRMESILSPDKDQDPNIVYWCPVDFPEDICIKWDFWPIKEPGLCIIFFAAKGRNGEDLFSDELEERTGIYGQYTMGDINAYHLSYFRRKHPINARAFQTCNLRKSHGFHMVARGGDPLPSVNDAVPPYHITLKKKGGQISFLIEMDTYENYDNTREGVTALQWKDDGKEYGPVLKGGKIGFRQMAPLIAEYANLRVYTTK